MLLYIHIGLHKTGTTAFQQFCNKNSEKLRDLGFYYEHQTGYPAHHEIAWRLLEEDFQPAAAAIKAAKQAECRACIFSSEDMEGLLFRPQIAARFEKFVRHTLGVEQVVWIAAIREPGAYFKSLMYELTAHMFVDAYQNFHQVMRRGSLYFRSPRFEATAPPFWFFSFAAKRHLSAFMKVTSGKVRLVRYQGFLPQPHDLLLPEIGAVTTGWRLVERSEINATPDLEIIARRNVEHLIRYVKSYSEIERMNFQSGLIDRSVEGFRELELLAEIVSERFKPEFSSFLNEMNLGQ